MFRVSAKETRSSGMALSPLFRGRIVTHISSKAQGKCSAKLECIVVTEEQELVRLSLWPPFHRLQVEFGGTITIERPRFTEYHGKTISTTNISNVSYQQRGEEAMKPLIGIVL